MKSAFSYKVDLLTHISLASFLWDIGKQKRGVPSGAILFAGQQEFHRKMKQKLNFTPDSLKNENVLIQVLRMGKSICHKWVNDLVILTML